MKLTAVYGITVVFEADTKKEIIEGMSEVYGSLRYYASVGLPAFDSVVKAIGSGAKKKTWSGRRKSKKP